MNFFMLRLKLMMTKERDPAKEIFCLRPSPTIISLSCANNEWRGIEGTRGPTGRAMARRDSDGIHLDGRHFMIFGNKGIRAVICCRQKGVQPMRGQRVEMARRASRCSPHCFHRQRTSIAGKHKAALAAFITTQEG